MTVSDRQGGFGVPPGSGAGSDGQHPEPAAEGAEQRLQFAKELAEAKAKADEYLDGWQRERAAFANYRKRAEQERASLGQEACADLVCQLLPVLDDLSRACGNVPADMAQSPWAGGVCMVLRKLEQTLERLGVEPIATEGTTFDPNVHEALTHEEATGYGEGDVIGEVTRGYRLGNRVLRCSLVRVAKGSSSGTD